MEVSVVVGAVSVSAVGIGVVWPNLIGGRFTTPFAGTVNGSDSPDTVCPFHSEVTRARTGPKFAGTFGSTHEPSAFCVTVRFKMLTVQFEPSWARAGTAVPSSIVTAHPIARVTNDAPALYFIVIRAYGFCT